ncbi:MAG: ABC-2 family transporter protein [Treponema sp.]|nr:ABC-2 family transporter protein [Treponema sp.]MCL2251846.1 ABC-2 family transporter protein [Treponema sp.]
MIKMLNAIKTKIDIIKAVAFVTFKEWGAYRTHSMVSIFVGPVYFIVQYFIWTAVYGSAETLNGMELTQMIRYFGATALIGYLTMDFADWNLDMLIRTGKFLTYTLRPLDHRLFAFSQKAGHRILGFIVEFIPCVLIFTLLFKIDMRPVFIGWTIASILLAYLMNFFVHYCLGMASFWIVQTGGLRSVYELIGNIFSGMFIPLVFFPKTIQVIQFFLPFQYTSYVPAMVFLGQYSLGDIQLSIPAIVGIQAIAVLVVFLVSELMYKAAMKQFTAVGA